MEIQQGLQSINLNTKQKQTNNRTEKSHKNFNLTKYK